METISVGPLWLTYTAPEAGGKYGKLTVSGPEDGASNSISLKPSDWETAKRCAGFTGMIAPQEEEAA